MAKKQKPEQMLLRVVRVAEILAVGEHNANQQLESSTTELKKKPVGEQKTQA